MFELLAQVHAIRGTKSRFVYDIPPPQPLSPRALQSPSTNGLDNLISYRRPPGTDAQPAQPKVTGAGVQARDRVLEAIAPMRRGRPNDTTVPSSTSRPSSPPKLPIKPDVSFGTEEDKAWKEMKSSSAALAIGNIRAHKSGGVTASVWKPKIFAPPLDDAWSIESRNSKMTTEEVPTPGITAFGDNFGEKLWSAFDGTKGGVASGMSGMGPSSSSRKEGISKLAPPPEGTRNTKLTITKSKDAFDGLGLAPSPTPAPTLGEARKLRTGLAAVNRPAVTHSPSISASKPSSAAMKPTSSPRPPAQLTTMNASWRSSPSMQPGASTPPTHPQMGEFSAETRFPSLEELDATFGVSTPPGQSSWQVESQERHKEREKVVDLPELSLAPSLSPRTPQRGTILARSEHVTGVAMRDHEKDKIQRSTGLENGISTNTSPSKPASHRPVSRPSLSRRHHSSTIIKVIPHAQLVDDSGTQEITTPAPVPASRKPKDWLTGDVDALISPVKEGFFTQAQPSNLPATPVLREFTNKRSSFIEENTTSFQSPQEAVAARQPPQRAETPPAHTRNASFREQKSAPATPKKPREPPLVAPKPVSVALAQKPDLESRHAVTSLKRPSLDDYDKWRAIAVSESPKPTKIQYSSSDEDGPEDAVGLAAKKLVEKTGSSRRRKSKGRQSSVHDLVGLWGGGVVQTKERQKDSVHSPAVAAFNGATSDSLVDLWGGGVVQTKERPKASVHSPAVAAVNGPTRDFAVKLQKSRTIAVSPMAKPRPVSPRMQSQPSEPDPSQYHSPSRSPKRASAIHHAKQASRTNTSSSDAAPASSSRMRPQSMFTFPMAKNTSDGDGKADTPPTSTTTANLSIPEDNPRKHGVRRTSISDMVQRFEAIGGKSKGLGSGPPVIAPKSSGLMMPASSATTGRAVDITSTSPSSPLVSRFTASRIIASSTEESGPGAEAGKSRPSAIDLARAALVGQDQSKANVSKVRSPAAGPPSGISSRLIPGSPAGRAGQLDGLPASPSFSPAMPPVPLEEARPPSPDKPFQGVGKLIDQWQRKTEVESSRAHMPRRGSHVSKRAGLVPVVGRDS